MATSGDKLLAIDKIPTTTNLDVVKAFLLLLSVVLVAIGIGVGVEALNDPSIYGPSGHQFVADFAVLPQKLSIGDGSNLETIYLARSGKIFEMVSLVRNVDLPTQTQTRTADREICQFLKMQCGWIAYAPLSDETQEGGVDCGSVHVRAFKVDSTSANLLYDNAGCIVVGRLALKQGESNWTIAANGLPTVNELEQFLTSFKLVGS